MNGVKTVRGVYLDIDNSPLKFDYENLRFYFSSELYLNKFKERLNEYVIESKLRFESRYDCHIENIEFFAIKLYQIIEKRGFKVEKRCSNLEYEQLEKYTINISF